MLRTIVRDSFSWGARSLANHTNLCISHNLDKLLIFIRTPRTSYHNDTNHTANEFFLSSTHDYARRPITKIVISINIHLLPKILQLFRIRILCGAENEFINMYIISIHDFADNISKQSIFWSVFCMCRCAVTASVLIRRTHTHICIHKSDGEVKQQYDNCVRKDFSRVISVQIRQQQPTPTTK